MSLVNNAWNFFLETYGPYFSSMLVSASDWLKLIFEKVWGFAYIKITLSTNLYMHNRFQGSFCCDLPLQDLNLVSASGGMVTGWNSHQPEIFVFKSSSQTQNCRAHKKGQLCHQDQPSPSFLTTSAMTASSGAFCKEDYKTSAEKSGRGGKTDCWRPLNVFSAYIWKRG